MPAGALAGLNNPINTLYAAAANPASMSRINALYSTAQAPQAGTSPFSGGIFSNVNVPGAASTSPAQKGDGIMSGINIPAPPPAPTFTLDAYGVPHATSAPTPYTGFTGFLSQIPSYQATQAANAGVAKFAQQTLLPQITSALRSGDYAAAWKAAGDNPIALGYLTIPQNLQAIAGGAFTPQQTQAFYTAAIPYAATIAQSGQVANYNNSTLNIGTANMVAGLQRLASGQYAPGTVPNVSGLAKSTASGGLAGFLDKAVPIALVGAVSAATGGALAPALGAVGAGAVAGGVGSALNSGIYGTPLTLGSVGKGAAFGALGGAANGYLKPVVGNATGLTGATGNIVNSGITGAATGAVGGALSGRGALAGASQGALSGAASAAGSAVAGSIFNTPGATVDPALTNSANPSVAPDPNNPASALNSNFFSPTSAAGSVTSANNLTNGPPMSANPFDPSFFDPSLLTGGSIGTGYGTYTPATDPNAANYSNFGATPGFTPNAPTNAFDPNFFTGGAGTNAPNLNGSPTSGGNSPNSALGGSAGSILSSLLGKLVGGGGSSGTGGSGSAAGGSNTNLLGLLGSLFGGGSGGNGLLSNLFSGGAGALNSQAAQYAAQQFAGQTKFNPYTVNGAGGSTSFDGTTANQSLSPQSQQQFNNLNSLANTSSQSLQGGTAGAADDYYKQLQASQADANNKMYQNNLDSQFGNGVLSSTAGQYQSQAALANISNQQLQDHVLANNFANTQQQNQLQQLTAGLNGMNQIQQGQNQQLGAAGALGYDASNANHNAYTPLAASNANSNLGNTLSALGNQSSNNNSTQSLLQLLGIHP